MKRFLTHVLNWKTNSCLMFTGSIIIYTLIALLYGEHSVSMLTLLSLLILSAVGSLFQYICFTDCVLKSLSYTKRFLLFTLSFGSLITICALIFNWFPSNNIGAWLSFSAIFVLTLVGITIGFEVYFRVSGKKYDGFLGQYHTGLQRKAK